MRLAHVCGLLLALAPQWTLGLQCANRGFQGEFDSHKNRFGNAKVVFVGVLEKVEPSPEGRLVLPGPCTLPNLIGTFAIEQPLKGAETDRVDVRIRKDVPVGERFLVFANDVDGQLRADGCCAIPLSPLPAAGQDNQFRDRAFLASLAPPGSGGGAEIHVMSFRGSFMDEGLRIQITDGSATHTATTMLQGRAIFKGLPPGRYRVIARSHPNDKLECRPFACDNINVVDRGFEKVWLNHIPKMETSRFWSSQTWLEEPLMRCPLTRDRMVSGVQVAVSLCEFDATSEGIDTAVIRLRNSSQKRAQIALNGYEWGVFRVEVTGKEVTPHAWPPAELVQLESTGLPAGETLTMLWPLYRSYSGDPVGGAGYRVVVKPWLLIGAGPKPPFPGDFRFDDIVFMRRPP